MRLLVKTSSPATGLRLGPDGSRAPLPMRPLMPAVDAQARGMGAAPGAAWHLTAELDSRSSPWDLCHALVRDGLALDGGGGIVFAEPDLGTALHP